MSATETEVPILYKADDGVALITLNRPDRLNALTLDMSVQYVQALRRADEDREVRVIVVTGAGPGFCAGADFKLLDDVAPEELKAAYVENPRDTAMNLRTPLIAAVNGSVAGAGLAHALMADIRFAAAGATWTTAFARLGLVAELGTSWLLPRQVGLARAFDLLYSSRRFTSEEAFEWGLVQQVHPVDELLDRTLSYARAIAAHDGHSLGVMRQQVLGDATRDWGPAFTNMLELVHEALERPEFQARLANVR
jgi:enoyl-CoA hydratase/carnithine racemase